MPACLLRARMKSCLCSVCPDVLGRSARLTHSPHFMPPHGHRRAHECRCCRCARRRPSCWALRTLPRCPWPARQVVPSSLFGPDSLRRGHGGNRAVGWQAAAAGGQTVMTIAACLQSVSCPAVLPCARILCSPPSFDERFGAIPGPCRWPRWKRRRSCWSSCAAPAMTQPCATCRQAGREAVSQAGRRRSLGTTDTGGSPSDPTLSPPFHSHDFYYIAFCRTSRSLRRSRASPRSCSRRAGQAAGSRQSRQQHAAAAAVRHGCRAHMMCSSASLHTARHASAPPKLPRAPRPLPPAASHCPRFAPALLWRSGT